jgi:hypothetical protein
MALIPMSWGRSDIVAVETTEVEKCVEGGGIRTILTAKQQAQQRNHSSVELKKRGQREIDCGD